MSRLPFLVIFLAVVLLATVAIIVTLIRYVIRKRPQFSLRTLMIFVTLVAVALSGVQVWRYWHTAHATWLDPSSAEARELLSDAQIEKRGERYLAPFRSNFRNFGELIGIMEKALIPTGSSLNTKFDHESSQLSFDAAQREAVEERLKLLKSSDTLQPGWSVIRGQILDSVGQPLAGATIDLMGGYVYINHFRTREDGTFVMPIQAPPGDFYYLRIRYGGDKDYRERNTAYFYLDAAHRERVVRIRVR